MTMQCSNRASREDSGIALETILQEFERVMFAPGDVVFLEDDLGDRAFVVESGVVEISKHGADGRTLTLGTIGAGSMFGEIALLDGQPRMANAIAMVPTQCIVLPRSLFLAETAALSPFTRFVVSTLLIHVRNLGIRMASPRRVWRRFRSPNVLSTPILPMPGA